jgi:lipopolysaccharide transport system permease protein
MPFSEANPSLAPATSGPPSPERRASGTARPTIVIERRDRLLDVDIRALWQYRELLWFLVWRDIKVRYKQTAIGAAWSVLQPLLTMLIFSVVFGAFAKLPSDGVPYPIFTYTALLPWTYFSQALSLSGASLASNHQLVTKAYFPRLIAPLSAVARPLVDFGCSLVVLFGMLAWFGIAPTGAFLALPALLLLATITALAVGLWLSALHARYRDIGYITPFIIQLWMFASPVVYPTSMVPEDWRLLYSLNPMAGVIEGFRWMILGTPRPDAVIMATSACVVVLLLIGGLVFFNRLQRNLADVI